MRSSTSTTARPRLRRATTAACSVLPSIGRSSGRRMRGQMTDPTPDDRIPTLVWVIAAVFVVVELAFSAGYGFQQDELYFTQAGRHLAFGYVDQPPMAPILVRLATMIGGTNPTAVRTLPALEGGAIIVL